MIKVNDVFEQGNIYIVVDFVRNGNVFYRRWIGDLFDDFLKLPMGVFARQVEAVHEKEKTRPSTTA